MLRFSKLSAAEREEIASMAAASYRNSGKHIAERYPDQVHHLFDGEYAWDFVWQQCLRVLGEERAQCLSTANTNRLVQQAQAIHAQYVSMKIVTERGAPIVSVPVLKREVD